MTTNEVEALVVARQAGAKINDLAKDFGVHRATVMNHLSEHGVAPRRRQGRTLTAEQIHAAGHLYASGQPATAVAEQFEVDRRYLRRVLPEAGFAMRPPGRAKAACPL